MLDKNKNRKSLQSDFLRYKRGEMSGAERNSFERELQKDPFAEEADEGYSEISADDAEKDLSDLQKVLNKRVEHKSRFIFYRYAAAVVVLVIVSTILILTQRKTQVVTLSENIRQEVKAPANIQMPQANPAPAAKETGKEIPSSPQPQRKSKDNIKIALNEVAEIRENESEKTLLNDSIATKPDFAIAAAGDVSVKLLTADKKMDMSRATEASGASGAPAAAKSESIRSYLPPQPVTGKDSFDIYIEKNLRNPEPGKTIQQEVVISFKVQADSTISEIKIITSPGRAWSKEATRLIKEGPVWKPATENGKVIGDEVRMRIVFR